MKTHRDSVLELLEFCLSHNIHPTEMMESVKKETKRGGYYEGLNPHSLLQDTRREMKPLFSK